MKYKHKVLKSTAKLAVVLLCVAGFIYQTLQFLLLYWTYPTVVDIQETIPLETEVPGITFCNINGIYPLESCYLGGLCFPSHILMHVYGLCHTFSELCGEDGRFPYDFTMAGLLKFFTTQNLNSSILERIKVPVKDFLKCKIVRGNEERDCGLDDVILGSYYSHSSMPNFCYTINSIWSNGMKKIRKIRKYDTIKLEFFIDMSGRGRGPDPEKAYLPKFSMPSSNTAIQLHIHSPYLTVSPFISGKGFLGGKRYQIKLKREEKHLLPPPYQTNCTDYLTTWKARGRIGPLDQMMVVEECKLNKTLEKKGCVPVIVDYPHNETICKYCGNCEDLTDIVNECTKLLDFFNQPCDFTTYEMFVTEKTVLLEKELEVVETKEKQNIILTHKGYNCSGLNIWKQKCQLINIEIVFEDLLVTNITYKPKIENLELFSVIGGYMGLYLGISFAATYDLFETVLLKINDFRAKRRKNKSKKRIRRNKIFISNDQELHTTQATFRRKNVKSSWTPMKKF